MQNKYTYMILSVKKQKNMISTWGGRGFHKVFGDRPSKWFVVKIILSK